jgi:hypothetical protein
LVAGKKLLIFRGFIPPSLVRIQPVQFCCLFVQLAGRDPLKVVIFVRIKERQPKLLEDKMPIRDVEKRRTYQLAWSKARREKWFKENGPCIDCGSWEFLELDHVDPSQKTSHRIWTWAESRRLEELSKCVARCKVCHRKKSNEYNSLKFKDVPSKLRMLSRDEVLSIRRLMSMGYPQRTIAPAFGVHRSVVAHISTGYAYAEIV